jgi:hypothetical protein
MVHVITLDVSWFVLVGQEFQLLPHGPWFCGAGKVVTTLLVDVDQSELGQLGNDAVGGSPHPVAQGFQIEAMHEQVLELILVLRGPHLSLVWGN